MISGSKLQYFAIETLPFTNNNGMIMSGKSWSKIGGKLVQVSSGKSVWGVNKSGNIYKYRGNNKWKHIPGRLTNVRVNIFTYNIICLKDSKPMKP